MEKSRFIDATDMFELTSTTSGLSRLGACLRSQLFLPTVGLNGAAQRSGSRALSWAINPIGADDRVCRSGPLNYATITPVGLVDAAINRLRLLVAVKQH